MRDAGPWREPAQGRCENFRGDGWIYSARSAFGPPPRLATKSVSRARSTSRSPTVLFEAPPLEPALQVVRHEQGGSSGQASS